MVFDEFLKAKNESLGPLWRKPAAWRAFRDVVSTGLVQFAAARCVAFPGLGLTQAGQTSSLLQKTGCCVQPNPA